MDINQLQEQYTNLNNKRDTISDQLQTLIDQKYKLSETIDNEKLSIENIKNILDYPQGTLSDLNGLLEIHEDEVISISDKAKDKEKELSDIDQQLANKKKQLDKLISDELCKRSLTVNKKNSYTAILRKNTSTTPLVTEYCKSDKEFMVLNAGMRLPKYKEFSYIIIRSNKTIVGTQKNVPTMSELKVLLTSQ